MKDRYKNKRSIQITLKRTGTKSYNLNDVDYFALWHEIKNGFYIIKNIGQSSFKITDADGNITEIQLPIGDFSF